jgi:hypothetical protein
MVRSLAVALVAAMLGGLAGAAIYAAAFDTNGAPERGAVVQLGPIDRYGDIDTTPYCIRAQHFCLIRLDSGEVRALYTYDPHTWFRNQSCDLVWDPDFPFTDPATGKSSLGWFRGGCSGSTFRYDGTRVFGPSPRDMDRFDVQQKSETAEGPDGKPFTVDYMEVDTRHLICGAALAGAQEDCQKAPEPQ